MDGAPQKDLRNEREQVRHGRRAGATNVSRYVTDDDERTKDGAPQQSRRNEREPVRHG